MKNFIMTYKEIEEAKDIEYLLAAKEYVESDIQSINKESKEL